MYRTIRVINSAFENRRTLVTMLTNPTAEQQWAVEILAATGDAYGFDPNTFPVLLEPDVFAFGAFGEPVRVIDVDALRAQAHLTYGDIARVVQDAWDGVVPDGVWT